MKKVVTPEGVLPSPNPLSPGIAAGGVVYVSGQVAPAVSGVEAQTRTVLEQIGAILQASGSDYSRVLRCGVYITDPNDFPKMNAVYKEFFPSEPPARSTLVTTLVAPEVLVEIDCIAEIAE